MDQLDIKISFAMDEVYLSYSIFLKCFEVLKGRVKWKGHFRISTNRGNSDVRLAQMETIKHSQPHNGRVMKLYSISDHFLGEDKSPKGESGLN